MFDSFMARLANKGSTAMQWAETMTENKPAHDTIYTLSNDIYACTAFERNQEARKIRFTSGYYRESVLENWQMDWSWGEQYGKGFLGHQVIIECR